MRITNVNEKPLSLLQFDLSDGQSSPVVQVRVVPADRYSLKATPVDAAYQVQARESLSGDPFVNIATSPIDLSSYPPETPVNFDVKVVAGSPLVGKRTAVAYLSVGSNGVAGW